MMKAFQIELDGEAEKFLYELTGQVVKERLQVFNTNCKKGHKITTYMCSECLGETIDRVLSKAISEKDLYKIQLFAQYFANAASCAIKFPEQHKLHVTDRCSMFEFLFQNADSKKPTLNFTGSSRHSFSNPYDQHNLEGFSTSAKSLINLFKVEVDMCDAAINHSDSRNTPEGFSSYIHDKFTKWKVAHFFEEAMSELMSFKEFKLF